MNQPQNEAMNPPDEFYKIINDFIKDILVTFPEYTPLITKWWHKDVTSPDTDTDTDTSKAKANANATATTNAITSDKVELDEYKTKMVFRHCVKVFPERFFDIIQKNNDIFSDDSQVSTEFLPGIVFKQLWNCDISENTQETIWKYLQLVLFSVMGTLDNNSQFGDASKILETFDPDELKTKLRETMDSMQKMFENKKDNNSYKEPTLEPESSDSSSSEPDTGKLYEHLHSLTNTKIGKLAMELTMDLAAGVDISGTTNPTELFQKLMKNPKKLMSMSSKLHEKIKSSDLNQGETLKETMDIIQAMQKDTNISMPDMPGLDDMFKLFSQMGAEPQQQNKPSSQKQKNTSSNTPTPPSGPVIPSLSEEELIKLFSKNMNTNAKNKKNKKK